MDHQAPAVIVNGSEFAGELGRSVTIGRDPDSDLFIDDPLVSRRHANLTCEERGWVFRDSQSSNGSFLAGQRVLELVLSGSLTIQLGGAQKGKSLELRVESPSPAAPAGNVTMVPDRTAPEPAISAPAGPAPVAAPAAPPVIAPVIAPVVAPASPFTPTHRVPASGLATWPEPEPTQTEGPRLEPGLNVEVIDRRDDWARVRCENGWAAWVDGRLLSPARPARAGAGTGIGLLVASVAAVMAGSFMPWFTSSGFSASAWKIPIKFLFVDAAATSGPKAGLLLLVSLAALLPALTKRPLPRIPLLLLSILAGAPPVAALNRVVQINGGPGLGFGAIVTFVGSLGLAAQALRQSSRRKSRDEPTR